MKKMTFTIISCIAFLFIVQGIAFCSGHGDSRPIKKGILLVLKTLSNTNLDENENSQISGDLSIKYLDAIIQTTEGDYSEENITHGKGMISLPGDYSMEIADISITVNPPDSDVTTDTYEEGK